MESVTEDSTASVPLAQLHRLQEKLLQEPDEHEATSAESGVVTFPFHGAAAHADSGTSKKDTANATRPHESSLSVAVPPKLVASKSTSAVDMDGAPNPSASQEAFATMTRASSFHGYPNGDTQPMESQVYRDFNASMIKSPGLVRTEKTAARLSPDPQPYTYDASVVEKPHTYVEGESGFVDLADAISSSPARSPSSFIEDLTSPRTQIENEAVFAMPRTPAIAGSKKRHSGEVLTSATTAPKTLPYSQIFGGVQTHPILSATQAFEQTQAPSSPLPNGPRSDPVITRPSPTFANGISTSSPPAMIMSSPVATMRPSTAGEPRDRYTSMRESQERRAARLRTEIGLPRDVDDDILSDEDDELWDTERQRFDKKRMQRVKSDAALLEFSKVRAPSRPGARLVPGSMNAAPIDLTTPAVLKKADVLDFELSDGDDDDDVLPEDGGLVERVMSDDEYDELGQTVLKSQGDDHDEVELLSNNEDDIPSDRPADVDDTRDNAAPMNGHDDVQDDEPPLLRTQHSTVADSQPLRGVGSRLQASQRAPHTSSFLSSFVPGSQYAGKTSQERARLSNPAPPMSNVGIARQHVFSSPSLPILDSTGVENLVGEEPHEVAAPRVEIPESDLAMSDARLSSPRRAQGHEQISDESNDRTTFSTAPTHLSQPLAPARKGSRLLSPLKIAASQQSNHASQSPLTAAGVRRFADLAATQSPRPSNDTDVNVDAIMNDIMTTADQDYIEAVSTPPQNRPAKRRKVMSRVVDADVGQNAAVASKPLIEGDRSVHKSSEIADVPDVQHNAPDAPQEEVSEDLSRRTLRESPGKATEMPSGTPESVRERELAGAKAASQLLANRIRKSAVSGKKGTKLKTYSKSRPTKEGQALASTEVLPVQEEVPAEDVQAPPAPAEAAPANQPAVGEIERIAPHRVFVLFKGQYNNFYTASWLNAVSDGSGQLVRFDDGTQTTIDLHHIRSLELRPGDQVKINQTGMRNKTWLVVGFGDVVADAKETDVFGRPGLRVQAKASRTSLPSSTAVVEGEGEIVNVAVSDVYITHTMWPHFADRLFVPPNGSSATTGRLATPSTGIQTPNSGTPGSRSRRVVIPTAKATHSRTSHLRDENVQTTDNIAGNGVFANMAFAISYVGPNDDEKAAITRLIRRNGGIVLESGFDELFMLPSLVDTSASPGKKSPKKDPVAAQEEMSSLTLHPTHAHLGFVALIADRHSRRAKYMQALALDIPTLSGRWVIDSLDPARNSTLSTTSKEEAMVLPWVKYLLPAGESSFLGGAVRSRVMTAYSAPTASLADTLSHRSVLLAGDGVLIVAPKKGKGAWERRKAYAFLTLALGAGRVKRVVDLQEAKDLVADEMEEWKWIYVDGSVGVAGAVVFGSSGAGGKKRKRGANESSGDVDANAASTGNGKVRIVNDEFVLQSLILGALID